MSLNRRGFALLELLVAALLSAVIAALAAKLLLDSAATLRSRSERMGVEHAFRVSTAAARELLEPLGIDSASGADLATAGPSSLVARAVRGTGVLCDAATDRLTVRAGTPWWRGLRAPVAHRDSLIVASVHGIESWILTSLSGNPSAGTCPDGSVALVLPATLSASSLASVGMGSPLQVFEPVELRLYPSSGSSWVGLRQTATGEAIQPLAGPFAASGPGLDYFDLNGNLTTAGSDVWSVVLRLEGLTERAAGVGVFRAGTVHSDSVRIVVTPRGRE